MTDAEIVSKMILLGLALIILSISFLILRKRMRKSHKTMEKIEMPEDWGLVEDYWDFKK